MPPVLAAAVAVPFAVALLLGGDQAPRADEVFRFADPAIVESSGLVVRDGLFVTINDSGDTGRVFVVDGTGHTVGVTSYGDATDVEAVAPAGPGEVLVGDIGDNLGRRHDVSVRRVPVGRGDRDDAGIRYDLVYPDGPQDAETLMVQPRTGRIVVVTKGVFGGRVLEGPRQLRAGAPNRMREIGTALGIATDGAFFPDGRHLIVRTYTQAAVYTWPALRQVARFDLPAQQQGEGIAVAPDGQVYLSSEGARSAVLRVRLPARVLDALDPAPTATPAPATTPGAGEGTEPDDGSGPWLWLGGGVLVVVAGALIVRRLG